MSTKTDNLALLNVGDRFTYGANGRADRYVVFICTKVTHRCAEYYVEGDYLKTISWFGLNVCPIEILKPRGLINSILIDADLV